MITAKVDISRALAEGRHAKQLPFALSRTINATLKLAQEQFLPTLATNFTLRGKGAHSTKPGTALGFNIGFSSKNNLTGTLGSRAEWWPLQEEGGEKRAEGHRLAIPAVGSARPTLQSIIQRKNKPRQLLVKAGDTVARKSKMGGKSRSWIAKRDGQGFVLKMRSSGRSGIFVRYGPEGEAGPRGVRRSNIRLFYWLMPDAAVKPALDFFSSTQKTIDKNLGPIFKREFQRALETNR